jgi:hypothetical protein
MEAEKSAESSRTWSSEVRLDPQGDGCDFEVGTSAPANTGPERASEPIGRRITDVPHMKGKLSGGPFMSCRGKPLTKPGNRGRQKETGQRTKERCFGIESSQAAGGGEC